MALINVKKKIEKSAEKIGLTADEVVVAACTTNPKGTIKRMMVRELGGVAAAAVTASKGGGAAEATIDEGTAAAAFPSGQRFLALTNKRLITCPVSALSGKPKPVDAAWERAQIASVEIEKGRMASPLTITFVDGSLVEIEGAAGTDPGALAEGFTTPAV